MRMDLSGTVMWLSLIYFCLLFLLILSESLFLLYFCVSSNNETSFYAILTTVSIKSKYIILGETNVAF